MSTRRRKLLIPAPNYARVALAVVCIAGATTAVLAALGGELRLSLGLAPIRDLPGVGYAWTHSDGAHLTGARAEASMLLVERWDLAGREGSKPVDSWRIDIGGARAWAVHPDKRLAAWIARGQLHSRPLGGFDVPVVRSPVPDAAVAAMGFLPDGRIAALFQDGTARAWKPYDHEVWAKGRLPLSPGDVAAFEDSAFSIWSPRRNRFAIYEIGSWEQRPETPIKPGATPVLLEGGHVVQLARNGAWHRGEFYQAPGPVRSAVVARIDGLVAVGDFEGVHLLSPEEPPRKLLVAAPRSSLALIRTNVVLGSPRGTTVFEVRGFELMTGRGRLFVFGAMALVGVLALYLLALFFKLGGKVASNLMDHLPNGYDAAIARGASEIPGGLLKGIRGGAVLWAGPGLSAQSGYPTWNEMLVRLREIAAKEKWFTPEVMEQLDAAKRSGNDQLLEEIVRGMKSRRPRMVEFVCNLYGLPAQLSKSHYALYSIPFRACVTTNYDNLLERLGPDWTARLFTARSEGYVRAAAHGTFFLWKLNGDLRHHDTILLCPSELYQAARDHARIPQTLHGLFRSHSFLFVGVSPERLLEDLTKLEFPTSDPGSRPRHWLVSGVSGRAWGSAARELDQMYGVRLIPFRASEVDAELPVWLGRLAAEAQSVLQTT